MAKRSIFDMILNTINDVQQKNKTNPNEETADPNVFDLIKSKLSKLDEKNREKRVNRGKSPSTIMDRIKKEILGAKRENKKDPNVKTAPGSVFDNILNKLDQAPKRQASTGLKKIIEDYNLDTSKIPKDVMTQVQSQYIQKKKGFDKEFAQALFDLTKKF